MSKLILSLDGGGIRGAATIQFLTLIEAQLQTQHNKSLRDCVNFYAGTSTGSLIALALGCTPLTVDEINDLYNVTNARKIFSENRGFLEFDGLNAPKYQGEGKTKVLKDKMGTAKIKDVPDGKYVLAVTYAVEQRRPLVVKSIKPEHRNLLCYKVADASSAAPTYFPTTSMEIGGRNEEFWLVDGGVTANNPTLCALAEARRVWKDTPLDDVRILSIGTGYRTRKINGPTSSHWGALQWFTQGHILDVLTDEQVVAYQAITLAGGGNYIRVNSELDEQPGLPHAPDDAIDDISRKNIKRLKEMGEFWFDRYGAAVIELLLGTYQGPSLDRINAKDGQPVPYE